MTSLQSAQRVRDTKVARVNQLRTQSPQRPRVLHKALRNAEAAERKLATALRRVDATRTGMNDLLNQIEQAATPAEKRRLVRRREEALWLREARKVQVQAMPPAAENASREASAAYDLLGTTREAIAQIDSQLAIRRRPPAALMQARAQLQTRALTEDVNYRVLVTGKAAAIEHLSGVEAAALATGDTALRDRIVYQSHLRAAVAHPGAHPAPVAVIVAERDQELAAELSHLQRQPAYAHAGGGHPGPSGGARADGVRAGRTKSTDATVADWVVTLSRMYASRGAGSRSLWDFGQDEASASQSGQLGIPIDLEEILFGD